MANSKSRCETWTPAQKKQRSTNYYALARMIGEGGTEKT